MRFTRPGPRAMNAAGAPCRSANARITRSRGPPVLVSTALSLIANTVLKLRLEQHDAEQEYAADHELPPRADCPLEIEQVEDDAEQQDADHRRPRASLAASQQRAADDHGGDRVELPSHGGH